MIALVVAASRLRNRAENVGLNMYVKQYAPGMGSRDAGQHCETRWAKPRDCDCSLVAL